MTIYTITILLSLLAYVATGNYVGLKIKGLEDYFVAGRRAPVFLIVGTLVASFLSSNVYIAQAGFNYASNAAFILISAVVLCGYIWGALYFGRYIRRSSALTVAEYFGQRFSSRPVRIIAGLTVITGLGFYLIAVAQGLALIISSVTPLSYSQALIITWASYTSFTFYAGSRGIIITDTMAFVFFLIVTFTAMCEIVASHGGWFESMDKLVQLELKPGLMAWHGMTGPEFQFETPAEFLIWVIIIVLAWSFVTAISPWQSGRYLMAKNEHVVLRSACVAAISVAAIQGMIFAAAPVVNLSNPAIEPRDQVLIWSALNMITPLVGALLLAGMVAAALSSASTFLSLLGFTLSHDLLCEAGMDERAKLIFSRSMMFIASVTILVVSITIEQNILWLTYFAGTLFASAWGPVAFMSIGSKNITSKAAFWGLICGFAGNVTPKLLVTADIITLPVYLDPIVIGAAFSLVVVLFVSRKTVVSDAEHEYRLSLVKAPEEELIPKEAEITLRYAYAIGIFGIVMAILLLILYVSPLQKAMATDRENFSFNWLTGEACLTYATGASFVLTGWLMRRSVIRDYRDGLGG